MEETLVRYHSELTAQDFIKQLINDTHSTVVKNRYTKLIQNGLPKHSIQYMVGVSTAACKHREPRGVNRQQKMVITEPNQSPSKMTRPHLQWNRSEMWKFFAKRQGNERIGESRKGTKLKSSNMDSQKSIASRSKTPRKFNIRFSKKTVTTQDEPVTLIPLRTEPEQHDETIGQLRAKKIKLEQAFKFFLEEELKLTIKQEKKEKEKFNNNFTTDYRGKVIQFHPRAPKGKDGGICNVRVQTLIDSSRMEGKLNLSATKRGFNREYFQELSNRQF